MTILTVSRLNHYIEDVVQQDYLLSRPVTVQGEVSGCNYHSKGNIYFTLKDEKCSVECMVSFRNAPRGRIDGMEGNRLEDGQSVIATGLVRLYAEKNVIKFYPSRIRLAEDSKGRLYEEYEKLKQKLYDEGLFDFEKKKKIPEHPRNIGIVTSPTGAAIQDIIKVSGRRNPYVQLILYPALVQGKGAAESIAKGIAALDKMNLDTIIVGRGGGSIEDLWAFNEEIVARAIYEAETPIISGTGHERDTTIADYAADARAATPSAAAEMAVDNLMETINRKDNLIRTLDFQMRRIISDYSAGFDRLSSRLEKLNPESVLKEREQQLLRYIDTLEHRMLDKYRRAEMRYGIEVERLNGLSPSAKLVNGFGYIAKADEPVNTVDELKTGDEIEITIHDGCISAQVMNVEKKNYKAV